MRLRRLMIKPEQMKWYFLDITATSDARETVVDMVRKVAEKVFIPFTVGGGIRTVEDFKVLCGKVRIKFPSILLRSTIRG